MAVVLDPVLSAEEAPRRVRFTRDAFDHLLNLGAFAGQRFELINGDLIDKMGQNPPHAFALTLLMQYLVRLFGIERIRCQSPIEVADVDREYSYPEPDLVVMSAANREYALRHPHGTEITLLVEVADTTSHFDRTVKSDLYARAGVPEYWVLDVSRRLLYLYRHPVNGQYSSLVKTTPAESVSPEAMPEAARVVSDLLPPLNG